MHDYPRLPYHSWAKRRAILAFAFLFALAPLSPALAREASRPSSASTPPKVERSAPTPTSAESGKTGPALREETKPSEPDRTPPAPGSLPDDKPSEGDGDEKPSKEEPVISPITSVNPAALSTNLTPSTIKQLLPEADATTGALVYTHPFTLPPGRNGMAPSLSLTYNNQRSDEASFVGHGWSLSVPYIERLNKTGTGGLYAGDFFSSSTGGELVPLGSGFYAAKVEDGSFLEYELAGGVWSVRDKSGTIYTYGADIFSRQDNPTDAGQVFTWMLSEIRDLNDNFISFTYEKDAGAIYPFSITYTGHGSIDGIFEVVFVREARPDVSLSYRRAFPVTMNDRLSSIEIYADGNLVRAYTLGYDLGDNGVRPLLTSITETGYDAVGSPTYSPATTFDYQDGAGGWSLDTSFSVPVFFSPCFARRAITDVNGDGIQDIVQHYSYFADASSTPTIRETYLGTGSGWVSSPAWLPPVGTELHVSGYANGCAGYPTGTQYVDVNGDFLVDIIDGESTPSNSAIYINTGSGWVLDPSWVVPHEMNFNYDHGVRLADVNGDGLVDFVWSLYVFDGNNYFTDSGVAINSGTGWVVDPTWSLPADPMIPNNPSSILVFNSASFYANVNYFESLGTEVVDANGDGLPDLISSQGIIPYQSSSRVVFLNTGSGWELSSTYIMPEPFVDGNGNAIGTRMTDVNGDGLVDVAYGHRDIVAIIPPNNNAGWGACETRVYINSGTNWLLDPSWTLPTCFNRGYIGSVLDPTTLWSLYYSPIYLGAGDADYGVQIFDANKDGTVDFVQSCWDNCYDTYQPWDNDHVFLGSGIRADAFSQMTTPAGGVVELTYQTPQQYGDNSETPLVFDTVSSITRDDGFGTISSATYSYEGGDYYYGSVLDRKFAGFHSITRTDDLGNTMTTWYHQGNATDAALGEVDDHIAKAGRAYRTEVLDAAGDLVQAVVNAWERADLGNGSNFVKLAQTLRMDYDGNADHRDRAVSYDYDDTNGNVTEMIEWGEVDGSADGSFADIGSDDRTTAVAYAVNTANHILGLPSQSTTTDASGTLVSDAKAYYDNLPLGSVSIGNETSEERWVADSEYVGTQKAYDGFGFLVSLWDELGRLTEYLPDVHELYVERTTNALGHETLFAYDLDSGQVTQTTDPNGRIFQTIYDGLNRSLETWQSSPVSAPILEQTAAYAYAWENPGTQTVKTEYFDAASARATYAYADGFDRTIQTRVQMKDAGTFAVTDTAYDAREYVESQSLPYESAGSSRTSPTADVALLSVFAYDALGRTTSVATAVGSTASAYDEWETTVTDPRGADKAFERDAYDRLVAVTEHDGSSSYATAYDYNARGDLTGLTDALGNTRSFTYDGLSRRLTAEDMHALSDATFGVWTYVYDDVGSLVSRTDPRGEVVTSEYDELNREIIRDALSTVEVEAMWSYDFCPGAGIGSVCEIATPDMTQMNGYDAMGRVSSIWRVVDGEPYTISFEYDRSGRVVETTYPDGSQSENVYGGAGYLEGVSRRESALDPFISVVSSIEYAPTGKRTEVVYGNGAVSVNTYDATELYRLRTRTTTSSAGVLQSLIYAYDENGNVTQIVDTSDTLSAKTTDYVYDDLNRLLSATVSGSANGDDGAQTFSYNALGNLLTRSDAGIYLYEGHLGANYANPHAATSVGGAALSYDESGNVANVAGSASYAWDAENRLVGVTPLASSSVPTSSFAYDPDGVRIKSVIGEETTIAPFNGYRVENDTVNKELFFDDGETAVTVEGTGPSAAVRYTHTDHLTGAAVVTDAAGGELQLLDYHPWGTQRLNEQASAFDIKRKFAGHESDDELGLSYMLARYYNPSTGKFFSEDPAFVDIGGGRFQDRYHRSLDQHLQNPQALNSYAYALNNPFTYRDPQGEIVPIILGWLLGSWPAIMGALALTATPVGVAMLAQDTETLTSPNSSNVAKAIAGASLIGSATPMGVADDAARSMQIQRAVGNGVSDAATHSVYRSLRADGSVEYVGRTGNFDRRAAEQGRVGRDIKPIEGLTNLTKNQARGAEQVLIENYGLSKLGGTLTNKINSISSSNPYYQNLKQEAQSFMKGLGIE